MTRGWPRGMHKETRGFDVELFANVLADLSQIMSALAAGTQFRFVEMFDSRQMIGPVDDQHEDGVRGATQVQLHSVPLAWSIRLRRPPDH